MEQRHKDGLASPEDALKAAYESVKGASGAEPQWLGALRAAGMEHFSETRFPTPKMEEWRFTNIAPIRDSGLMPAQRPTGILPADVDLARIPDLGANTLVFVDGFFAAGYSKTDGRVRVGPLSSSVPGADGTLRSNLGGVLPPDSHPFAALNTALWRDGAFVLFPKGTKTDEPVHLLFISTGEALVSPRVLIVAESCSEGAVVETYRGAGESQYWMNAVSEIAVGDGARLEHTKFQCESAAAFHTAAIRARVGRDACFSSHSIALGAMISRNDIGVALEGQNSLGDLNGLYICRDTQLCDHHTVVDHAVANCGSHEFYHGILDERSRGVFNGKIFVRKGAQKTDAKQTNRGLLLSDGARIDTKPQLEIFADDVKCTHGATVGRLDKSALYYLRARGIGPAEAGRMLTHAFAGEIIGKIGSAPLRDYVDKVIFDYLEGLPALG